MIESNIRVNKTARYFLSQKPNANIQEVWIVCHGYGQLANKFLSWFNPIFSKNILVVAPEGLNRFYRVGFNGNVGASWMTKEDRQNDIEDSVTYLDQVYNKIKSQIHKKAFFHVLGFSQGTATACRWIAMGKSKIDFLTLWAGNLPDDIDYSGKKDLLNKLSLKVIIGDNDEFYSETIIKKKLDVLKELNLKHLTIRFKGGHSIPEEPLKDLKQKIQQEIIDKQHLSK